MRVTTEQRNSKVAALEIVNALSITELGESKPENAWIAIS
jgi:hypothetical protein